MPDRPRSIALGSGVSVPYPEPTSEAATAVGRANPRTGTRPEMAIRSSLHQRGLRFRKDFRVSAGNRKVRADVVFPRQKVAVFVDGCFWHGCPLHATTPKSNQDYWVPKLRRNRERDVENTIALQEAGWRVIRIWEHENAENAASVVESAVRGRRDQATR